MQDRGYLERGRSEVDKRRQTLDLLPAGRLALRAARKAILDHEKWLKSRFTGREVDQLIRLLTRIHE